MSAFHFTATEGYRRRVIQLGEHPDRVFNMGALGAENCRFIERANVDAAVAALPDKGYAVIAFHPETLTQVEPQHQVQELLAGLSS